MNTLNIKPLSVNAAWQGKRYRTDKYKKYQKDLRLLLPNIKVPEGRLKLFLEFGFSSKASDLDNPIKCFQDCLQKKYNFDDKNIYEYEIKKIIVRKGQEYIKFKFKQI